MIFRWVACFTVFCGAALAGSVSLVNDTAFKLRAVVRSADGTYLGEVVVNAQATMQWNDYWGGVGTVNKSQTPYIVTWYCMNGDNYSVCSNVATGATVAASWCDGPKFCKPPKPPPAGAPAEEHLQPEEPEQQNVGPP